jgi:diguanylate cyclase (GGDEF)-like protein
MSVLSERKQEPKETNPISFAPAERADRETLTRQIEVWKREEHAHLIAEAVPTVILVLNNTRQVVYANSRVSLFGKYNLPESYLGKRLGELLSCTHVEDSATGCGTTSFCEHCGAVNAILTGLSGKTGAEECIITRSNGEAPYQLRVMSTPVRLYEEDYVIFSIEDIRVERENKRLLQEVQRLAVLDPLTGVPNRRSFFEHADREFKRAKRYHHPVVVLMFDADRFKNINDTYGHQAGDTLLKTIAMGIRANLRDLDIFARYGGDEFIAMLPETAMTQGKDVAGRIVAAVSVLLVRFSGGIIHPSVTAGIAEFNPDDQSLDALIARADADLFRQKRAKQIGGM